MLLISGPTSAKEWNSMFARLVVINVPCWTQHINTWCTLLYMLCREHPSTFIPCGNASCHCFYVYSLLGKLQYLSQHQECRNKGLSCLAGGVKKIVFPEKMGWPRAGLATTHDWCPDSSQLSDALFCRLQVRYTKKGKLNTPVKWGKYILLPWTVFFVQKVVLTVQKTLKYKLNCYTWKQIKHPTSQGKKMSKRLDLDGKIGCKAVSYEKFSSRTIWVGGVKKIPWKKSSGAQSEDLGPSLPITNQEFFQKHIPGFICSVFRSAWGGDGVGWGGK